MTGIVHDRNGNMTQMPKPNGDGVLNCVYDAWNRMVEVVGIALYRYDGRNHRIGKTVGQVSTKSFLDRNWRELESQADSEMSIYIWGLRYIDDLIYREKGNERHYSLADPNWNVVATADSSGDVQERMKYDAFGKITWLDEDFDAKTESAFAWDRTFTGQFLDAETGLMLYRMRYFNTLSGRFTSRDPIDYNAEDMNVYRYVKNMSIHFVDIFGLDCCDGKEYDSATQCCEKNEIKDRYKICIMSEESHSWIHVTNYNTGEEHTYSRFRYSHNPTGTNGVKEDIELKACRTPTHKRCQDICGFTPTIDSGYNTAWNNCSSYSVCEWNRCTGENLSSIYCGIMSHPIAVNKSITKANFQDYCERVKGGMTDDILEQIYRDVL